VAACVDRGGIEHLMNRLTTDDINSILVRRPAGAPEALVVGGTRRSSAPASQTSAGMTCGTSGPAGTCRTVRPSCASRARRLGDFRNGAPVCALLGRAPGAVCGSTVCATAGDGACGGTNLSQASNLRCQAKLSHWRIRAPGEIARGLRPACPSLRSGPSPLRGDVHRGACRAARRTPDPLVRRQFRV